jgi:hypothetical protein
MSRKGYTPEQIIGKLREYYNLLRVARHHSGTANNCYDPTLIAKPKIFATRLISIHEARYGGHQLIMAFLGVQCLIVSTSKKNAKALGLVTSSTTCTSVAGPRINDFPKAGKD